MTWKETRSVHHRDAIRANTVGVDNGKRLMKVVLAQSRWGLWAAQEGFAEAAARTSLPQTKSHDSDGNKGTPKAMVFIPSS